MPSEPEQLLIELLDRIIDRSYSERDRAEFSRLMDEHPELTPQLVQQLRTHSYLHWMMAPTAGQAPPTLAAPATRSPIREQTRKTEKTGEARGRRRALAAVAALAACIALLLGAYAFWSRGPEAIGRVIASRSVRLAEGTTAALDAKRMAQGILELESGSVTIEFISGVQLEIAGPARCELKSEMLVRLLSGQATAQVPRWARGFTIETPDIGVVDLGTRFGVAKRESGITDVVVFEGRVDLKSLPRHKRRFERRLSQGEAARIDSAGEIERIFQVHGDSLSNAWSTLDALRDGGVITAVWDNLGATKSVSYYQVVPRGLTEDASAYVDHPHQWNGLTPEGLPELLRGADCVRTVNDYRYLPELALKVEFAADANLFVMFDDRVSPPDWLTAQFVDTGLDVGLDEDAWGGNPMFTLEEGPGKSIDNVFSVWRRECARGEVLTLGSVGEGGEARAMYGLAATPR